MARPMIKLKYDSYDPSRNESISHKVLPRSPTITPLQVEFELLYYLFPTVCRMLPVSRASSLFTCAYGQETLLSALQVAVRPRLKGVY